MLFRSGAKEMNKLKDPNGVYQDFLQSGDFKFGPGDVKYADESVIVGYYTSRRKCLPRTPVLFQQPNI